MVFGKNGGWTANLADPIQYYEMAAAALYAKIVNDEEIARRDSNARSNIGSFASATFGVDSVRIQVYLETAVQKEFLLSQFAKADQAMIDSVKKIVEGNGPVPDAESFLGKNHLWIPSDLKITGDNDPFGAETSLLHKMLKSLEKGMDDIFGPKEVKVGKSNSGEAEFALTSSLREALEKGDVNQVKDKVKKLKLDELTDCKVAGFLNTILAPEPEAAVKLDSEHLAETLRTLAMEMFDQDNVLSLRRTVLFVEKLTDLFSGYSKTLASCDGKVDDLITQFNEEVDKASAFDLHGFAVWGNRFNKAEIRNLCKQFELKVREALLIRIRGVLKDFFDGAVKELKNIKGRLDLMSEFLEESGRLLEANLKPVFRDKPYEDIFNELFIDPEVEGSVLGAIPKADDVQLLYKRSLKPILSRDKLRNLLRDKENYDPGNRKGIKQCITDALLDLLTGEYESEDDAWDEIPTKISDVIVANVRLKADSAGLSFIARHFSFRKVLDDNTKVWGELLA
ncbi:MAG: hypothetical protein J6W70_03005, partial [Lentisphaeria bacterium]|nr:hypothetical protein [Lentisphaeria bacterium]